MVWYGLSDRLQVLDVAEAEHTVPTLHLREEDMVEQSRAGQDGTGSGCKCKCKWLEWSKAERAEHSKIQT